MPRREIIKIENVRSPQRLILNRLLTSYHLKVWTEATVAAEYLLVDDRCDRQTIKAIGERFP